MILPVFLFLLLIFLFPLPYGSPSNGAQRGQGPEGGDAMDGVSSPSRQEGASASPALGE